MLLVGGTALYAPNMSGTSALDIFQCLHQNSHALCSTIAHSVVHVNSVPVAG